MTEQTTVPLSLDRTRGHLVLRPGARAVVHLDDPGDLPRGSARLALYQGLLDGRCRVPDEVAVELDLVGKEPRVLKPVAWPSVD